MKRILISCLVPICILGSGCVTTDQRVIQLQNRNRELTKLVGERETAISVLKDEKGFMQRELAYYTTRARVLQKEKAEHVSSTAELRDGIRSFTDGVMKSLRSYYQKTEIVDYIGSEVYKRNRVGKETNHLLVDLHHPLTADATLIGSRAYMTGPARLVFCLLRPLPQKKQLEVVRMSDALSSKARGLQSWTYQVPLTGKKGDYIGVYFPEAVPLPYDDVDTGNAVLIGGPVQVGDTFPMQATAKRNKRAYSFGMVGFLNK